MSTWLCSQASADICFKFDLKFNKTNPIVSLTKLEFLIPQHAAKRVEDRGPLFQDLTERVLHEIGKNFASDDLSAAGIEGANELRLRVENLLKVSGRNFIDASQFVRDRRYFFCDDTTEVELEMPARLVHALGHSSFAKLNDGVVREKVIELFSEPDTSWPSGISATFPQGLVGIIEALVDDYRNEMRISKEEMIAVKAIYGLVHLYLRGWIAWGKSGPATAKTMELLGREVSLRRIKQTKIHWRA